MTEIIDIRRGRYAPEQALQLPVEKLGAERAAIHRGQHLDFARVSDAEAAHQPILHQLFDRAEDVLGGIAFEEKEIALRVVLRNRHLAPIQPMRI